MDGEVGDSSLQSGDWRMVTVKRHLPYSGHEGLQEVRKISERSKENIYTAATSRVEYYFRDENLRIDKFLLKYLAKDEEGYVPVAVIASFKKMKKLTHHKSFIVAALKESSLLTLSSNEKKVKRVHPFPLTEALDTELCTVLIENLPEDHTIENMKKIFGEAGRIKKITIHEENATREQTKCSIEEKLLSGNVSCHNSECCVQLHAVVEYDTVEAAENAVATLNNEQDWRHGMRVKLLKCKAKNTQRKKGHDSEKKINVQVDPPIEKENQQLSDHHDEERNQTDINPNVLLLKEMKMYREIKPIASYFQRNQTCIN
ncbi:hypothetical protein L2E82_25893 [Cichorium intybus]|uniref:Uncharacterized protein n=1 Tax=Cichorium intybus TaxID=13427 RepID=A0ACB9E4H9_CICIN|nr:hypothetical protein L2E82_25893 [Cichorium intybus]